MSARRRQGRESAFSENNVSAYTLEAADEAVFGKIAEIDEGKQVAKPISIFDIAPDPTQPRRAVPAPVRQQWNGRPDDIAALFSAWNALAAQERGVEVEVYNVDPYLLAREEAERPKKIGPIEASFLDIIELAANIRQNGLTNPITISRAADGYRVETGERRWLAYHLLYLSFVSEQKTWEKIPARVVDEASVWRQASENGVRSNLNAVSRARQFAILLMELYRQQGVNFQPFEQVVAPSGCDRAYYAQVADSTRFPIPKGSAETLLNAMGFKQSTSQLREYRDLLRLPDEVWQIADDLNWTQGSLRDLDRKAYKDRKKLITLAVIRARNVGYSVGVPTLDSPTPLPKKDEGELNPLIFKEYKRLLADLWTLAIRVGEGDAPTTREDLEHIRVIREWLKDLEIMVEEKLKK